MALSWADLFAGGSIVDLNVSQWSGKIKVQPMDLGIDSEAVTKALTLGHHRLVPPGSFENISRIISQAKATIDKHGMTFPFIKGARFIPEKNLPVLMEKLGEHAAEFDNAITSFTSKYQEIATQMRPIIWQALNDAAVDTEERDKQTVLKAAMTRIDLSYPSVDTIRDSFSMKWSVYAIKAPESAAGIKVDLTEVQDVLKTMVSNLRGEVIEKLEAVLAIVAKGGTIKKTTMDGAIAVLDRVDSVNVFGDKTLTQQVTALRKILASMDPKNVGKEAVIGIETIKKTLESDIEQAVVDAENNLTALGRRNIDIGD